MSHHCDVQNIILLGKQIIIIIIIIIITTTTKKLTHTHTHTHIHRKFNDFQTYLESSFNYSGCMSTAVMGIRHF